MSRIIDPHEALVMLKTHQPNFDRMAAAEAIQQNQNIDEIAMLERRVQTLYEDVDLGNGDKIRIRAALSEEEFTLLGDLERQLTNPKVPPEEKTEITYQMLELMTMNPYLTADWFRENRNKWPVNDGLSIILGYVKIKNRQDSERAENIKSFRNK